MIKAAVDITDDGLLMCPNCDSDYLHHRWIREYEREGGEDGPSVANELYGTKFSNVNFDAERNPSSRRDGIRIAFYCEGCEAHVELAIAQHKGQTFLHMDFIPQGRAGINIDGETLKVPQR